jgi:hypothetical protein
MSDHLVIRLGFLRGDAMSNPELIEIVRAERVPYLSGWSVDEAAVWNGAGHARLPAVKVVPSAYATKFDILSPEQWDEVQAFLDRFIPGWRDMDNGYGAPLIYATRVDEDGEVKGLRMIEALTRGEIEADADEWER